MSLDFGSPSDIRLPNRRTAQQEQSPRFQHELDAIRSELAAVTSAAHEVNAAAGASSASPASARPSSLPTNPAATDEEITNLYHELQRTAAKLDHEKNQRKKVESELEHIRTQRLRDTADVVQELERKRVELSTLREERSMMKEWLDRGVAECKRVADDVSKLKGELEVSEKSCTSLARDKQKLTGTIQQLSDELATVQVALEKIHHEKSILELKSEESSTTLTQAEEQRRAAVGEADRLSSEVTRLSQRVRGLEDAELAMQSMCNCVAQLTAEVQSFDGAVARGDLDQILPHPPITDAAHDVGQPKPLSSMVIDAKRLLQTLQENVSRLHVSVKRFLSDKQVNYTDTQRAQQMELETLQRDRDVLVQQYQSERDTLRRRVQDLEKEIVNVADGVQRDIGVEATERLGALDRLSKANADLSQQNEKLREENDKLRAKAKKMKIDWSKVDESRRRFQQLQVEVQLMREYNDKLTVENRNLTLMMDSNNTHGGQSASFHAPHAAMTGNSPSSFMVGSSPAAAAAAPSAGNAVASHRHAFEEWKAQAVNNSNVYF